MIQVYITSNVKCVDERSADNLKKQRHHTDYA